jgi:hypothetical protein
MSDWEITHLNLYLRLDKKSQIRSHAKQRRNLAIHHSIGSGLSVSDFIFIFYKLIRKKGGSRGSTSG